MKTTGLVRRSKGRRSRRGASTADSVGQYATDAWSLARRTAYGLNEIRKLINIEEKFCDATGTNVSTSSTGVMNPVSELAQGLTSATRVGDSIRIQHIEVCGRILANPDAGSTSVRVMIVRDLDGYGTAPTPADVLESTATAYAPFAPKKFNKRERFSVLFDELFTVQGTDNGIASAVFSYSSPHKGHVLYLGTTAATASDGKGSVYVVLISDEASNPAHVTYFSRITYTDD